MNSTYIFIVFSLLIISCREKNVVPPKAVLPVPSPAQIAWHEMETNAFIHFSINTFTDKEWGYGDESPKLFNPTALNVNQWVSTLKETGFKGVILTTKHHDGFCLWPSAFTAHSIANSPYKEGKGDLVKELADATRSSGLKFGIYMSPWDRNRSDYGQPEYVTYYRNQLTELFDHYGPVFEMWFDGANGGDGYYGGAREKRKIDGSTYYNWPATLNMVRKLSPDIIFFSDAGPGVRWVGNEKGIAGETNWNSITPDTLYAGKAGIETLLQTGHPEGTHWIPAEVDVSIRPGWFYHAREDSLVKSVETLFDIYLTSVGRGSTLLLNVPPDTRGLIHDADVAILKKWRATIDSVFKTNFATEAEATASNVRGDAEQFRAVMAIDQNPETYWSTDDDQTTGSIEITLKQPQTLHYIMLQEYIKLGQRVKNFTVEYYDGTDWKPLTSGTTIGYKRILRFDPVSASKVKITIGDSRACPLLSNIAVY